MKETAIQRAKRQHKELMNNVIEARQHGSEDNWKIEVTYSSGAKRTFKNEPSWFEEYIEDAWSILQNDFTVYAASRDYIKANYSPVELEAPVEVEEVQAVEEAPEEVEEASNQVEVVLIKVTANREENFKAHTMSTTAKFELTYSDGSTKTIETISNNDNIQIPSDDIAYFMLTSKHQWNANCYWYTEEIYTATPETKKVFKEASIPVEYEVTVDKLTADEKTVVFSTPVEEVQEAPTDTEKKSIELSTNLSDSFKNYAKLFKKYGITPADIDDLNNDINSGRYTMECTVTRYTKKAGYKTFSGATIETETFNIDANFYYNCITGITFFHDKAVKSYTPAGNIITSLTCYNPDKTVKMVRTFKIINN